MPPLACRMSISGYFRLGFGGEAQVAPHPLLLPACRAVALDALADFALGRRRRLCGGGAEPNEESPCSGLFGRGFAVLGGDGTVEIERLGHVAFCAFAFFQRFGKVQASPGIFVIRGLSVQLHRFDAIDARATTA